MKTRFWGLALLAVVSCQRAAKVEWVSTTFDNPWQEMEAVEADAPAAASSPWAAPMRMLWAS